MMRRWVTAFVIASSLSPSSNHFQCATATTASTPSTASFIPDPSYVVQIHSSRNGFIPPIDTELRTQFMTTEAGQRFECFLPLTPEEKVRAQQEKDALTAAAIKGRDTDNDKQAFMTFARAASKKNQPKCLQYVDVVEKWMYEICPGNLIRKVHLIAHSDSQSGGRASHEIRELAVFATDDTETKMPFSYYASSSAENHISKAQQPLYTQVFHARNPAKNSYKQEEQEENIKVQFLCNSKKRDDSVAAVQWREYDISGPEVVKRKEPIAFLIFSRVFCDARYSELADQDDLFTVSSLLRPLVDRKLCIKRNEGWWTYEFCFGNSIRQYHRESDGQVSVEYSLGSYDEEENRKLEKDGTALVLEHIDATHDVSRPAFKEIYSSGTACSDAEGALLRQSKVFYYCSHGGMNHHILSVKETQTCTYTIKISSPAVCDHPHFITEEQKSESKAEIVHCVPVQEKIATGEQEETISKERVKEVTLDAT